MSGLNPLNLLFGAAGALLHPFGKKAKPAPVPLPQVQLRSDSGVADALASRRGSRANQRTGLGGAEPAAPGGKSKLGA